MDFILSLCSGPALGVVAGSKLPSYCIMCRTATIARRIECVGEGMRIHIRYLNIRYFPNHEIFFPSETSKQLLDKVGGFRCDYRGTIQLGVGQIKV